MEGSLRGVNILIHAEGFQSGGTQPASGCFIQNIKGSRRVEKLLPCCQHLLEHTIQLRTHERGQTGRRDHWKIQDRIDWAPDHPGRTEFRRCGQDVVENLQQLMVVFDFDISALRRRSETWLLLKHLRKIHQHDRVILDHLLKFPDYRMKRSCLFLSDFSGVRKPSVQNLPVRREPMSETAGLFVVCRVVHVSLEQCTSTCRRRCSDCCRHLAVQATISTGDSSRMAARRRRGRRASSERLAIRTLAGNGVVESVRPALGGWSAAQTQVTWKTRGLWKRGQFYREGGIPTKLHMRGGHCGTLPPLSLEAFHEGFSAFSNRSGSSAAFCCRTYTWFSSVRSHMGS